ncbi:MAG: phosphoglucosamine mutase [Acidobacteria bacterium]|nr:phosphoglucosamine mutase [Acidobacteriota bacterium]
MRTRFGTDGMRGIAGHPPLDPGTLYRLGRALVAYLAESGAGAGAARICLGRDTRESCAWIEAALARGIRDGGGVPVAAGVLPTPGLALVTRELGFAAGLMISASHNPYQDNGVKVFDASGSKLADAHEERLEQLLDGAGEPEGCPDLDPGTDDQSAALQERYLEFLVRCCGGASLDGLAVVLDTAHGAASRLAPAAFRRAGARVTTLGDAPDGRNINDGVGSLHPELMAAEVRRRGADIGFSFDGDADRCIAASRKGAILDGDFALYYAGRALHRAGRLPGATVVSTVMSNLGLQKALESEGIRMLRAAVGDRYVLQAMREGGYTLGGEQSGHVIFMDQAPTGDGILTALNLCRIWREGAGDLDAALAAIPHFPQRLDNIKVRSKPDIETHPVLSAAVRRAERELGADGRVVVRYSGTEPKARVMIEGPDRATVDRLVEELVAIFRKELA